MTPTSGPSRPSDVRLTRPLKRSTPVRRSSPGYDATGRNGQAPPVRTPRPGRARGRGRSRRARKRGAAPGCAEGSGGDEARTRGLLGPVVRHAGGERPPQLLDARLHARGSAAHSRSGGDSRRPRHGRDPLVATAEPRAPAGQSHQGADGARRARELQPRHGGHGHTGCTRPGSRRHGHAPQGERDAHRRGAARRDAPAEWRRCGERDGGRHGRSAALRRRDERAGGGARSPRTRCSRPRRGSTTRICTRPRTTWR